MKERGMKFGVTEWMCFTKTVTGAGINRMWEMPRAFWAFRASEVGSPAGLHALREREEKELGPEQAKKRALELDGALCIAELVAEGRVPLWRAVTGILARTDQERMHPDERFGRYALLVRAVERMVRYEWRAFRKKAKVKSQKLKVDVGEAGGVDDRERWDDREATPSSGAVERAVAPASYDEQGGRGSWGEGESGDAAHLYLGRQDAGGPNDGDPENDDPRVSWWDPLRVVGEQLGMAYSALSRVCREIAGLSASDVTDRVKSETVRDSMRADVKRWLVEIYEEHPELKEMESEEALEKVWDFLQAKRGRGKGSRASWACAHGFPSYTRFHKACLAGLGISPIELERVVLEEVLEEMGRREARAASSPGADLERGGIQNSKSKIQNGDGDGAGLKVGDGTQRH
jgi:hypothetical protein